jgi:hypothetical protein
MGGYWVGYSPEHSEDRCVNHLHTPKDACVLCEEPIGPTEDAQPCQPGRAHRECLLRAVVGGIGHHEDHVHWCGVLGDPDGGRTYRQSALEVDALIRRSGLP